MRQKMKGVIITVYEESPASTTTTTTATARRRQKRSRPIPSAHGYDRRARLLAYARELRVGNAKSNSGPTSSPKSRPKPKISRFPASIRRLFQRHYRYERIVPEEVTTRNKEKKTRIDVKLCKKLRAVLKQFSCGWRCNNR